MGEVSATRAGSNTMEFFDLGVRVAISMACLVRLVEIVPKGTSLLCFHCNQVGHEKANCLMLRGRAVCVPAPVTLRITDGHEGKVDVPMVRRQALQPRAEEIRVPLVDVANILF